MKRAFNTEKYLENRQFINCDQIDAPQKIKQLKKGKLKPLWLWKLKDFLMSV